MSYGQEASNEAPSNYNVEDDQGGEADTLPARKKRRIFRNTISEDEDEEAAPAENLNKRQRLDDWKSVWKSIANLLYNKMLYNLYFK